MTTYNVPLLLPPNLINIDPAEHPELWAQLQPILPAHADHFDRVHYGYCYLCQVWLELDTSAE